MSMKWKHAAPRALSRAFGATVLLVAAASAVQAYSDQVVENCTEDYFAYCKQHMPESVEVRYCMEAHRNELSKRCVQALIDAGEVPRKYLIKKVGDRQ